MIRVIATDLDGTLLMQNLGVKRVVLARETSIDEMIECEKEELWSKIRNNYIFRKYNRDQMKKSKKNGAFATDPAGVTHYLGVYENDGVYDMFVTMGAKKYAYKNKDGIVGITVAGVAKKLGGSELLKSGGLKKFKTGFCFREAGGTESVYNDMKPGEHFTIIRENKKINVTSNVFIRDSEYTLGSSADYVRILDNANFWRDMLKL